MARNVRSLTCSPEAVFHVLGDGWLYPSWVVGASRMRDVDPSWPDPGARLHHSVGLWPFLIDHSTQCLEWDPPHRMEMVARLWPVGEARVAMDVRPYGDGCLVRIQEEAISGPLRFMPFADLLLRLRNAETLHRLAYLAEGLDPKARESTARDEGTGTEHDPAEGQPEPGRTDDADADPMAAAPSASDASTQVAAERAVDATEGTP